MGELRQRDGRACAPRKAAGLDLALAAITAVHKAAGIDTPYNSAGDYPAAPTFTSELRRVLAARPAMLPPYLS